MASVYYENWVSRLLQIDDGPDQERRLQCLYTSFRRCSFETVSPILSNLSDISKDSLLHLSGAWFRQLVEVTENLPLCLLLILPTHVFGFPVIYANTQLHSLLGYSRAEWIGKACPLVGPSPLCDPHFAMVLQDMLFRTEPGRFKGVVKTGPHLREAGTDDVELMALCKPLYDESGIHRFSVCVLSSDDDKQRQFAGDFLSSVPNMIFI